MLTLSFPAFATPLTDSISDGLRKMEVGILADAHAHRFCSAQTKVEAALSELNVATEQIAEDKPIDLPTIATQHVRATPVETIWILQAKRNYTSWQHEFVLLCSGHGSDETNHTNP
ncbi:MAG TPA: hypothetical protein VM659_05120 [Dongiaceae bacterium]|nr:hypothetical protein [Dongiaceae bacterium]